MKRYLSFVIVAAVGLLTLETGTMLYQAKRLPALAIPKNSTALETAGTEYIHVHGEAKAPVTLEEFGDFLVSALWEACRPNQANRGGIRFPAAGDLPSIPTAMHAHAQEAAPASEAAGFQGRFWEMHDLLYRERAIWSKADDARTLFSGYAGMLGLNLDRFKTDMNSSEAEERATADQKRGVALRVNSTPTIFINDRQIPAPVEIASLRTAIDAALKVKLPP
jgi:protein-disulfide isomerase